MAVPVEPSKDEAAFGLCTYTTRCGLYMCAPMDAGANG